VTINERKLRRLLTDNGLHIHDIRSGRHWMAKVSTPGGPVFGISVSRSPGSWRFDRDVASDIRRRDREARAKDLIAGEVQSKQNPCSEGQHREATRQ
jgi:hypothetical protein